ncbi:MAG: helix-turn-helix domain-containing protein [Desulfovibrio sp.]|jgi:excisionase family DNA binding protein|nr:helix-turn-helix domain-containing protein [Desulfovibrio sp.]
MAGDNDTGRIWLTEKDAAEYLQCSKSFLAIDRTRNRRIPFSKLGNRIRYSRKELDAYLERNRGF